MIRGLPMHSQTSWLLIGLTLQKQHQYGLIMEVSTLKTLHASSLRTWGSLAVCKHVSLAMCGKLWWNPKKAGTLTLKPVLSLCLKHD